MFLLCRLENSLKSNVKKKKKKSCNITTPQTTVSKTTTTKKLKLWSAGLMIWKKKISTDTGTDNTGETKSDNREVAKKWNDDEGMKRKYPSTLTCSHKHQNSWTYRQHLFYLTMSCHH